MSETIFYRWIKNGSYDLMKALEHNTLTYTEYDKTKKAPRVSNKARWIFIKGGSYFGSKNIMKDRLLVVFTLSIDSSQIITNSKNHVNFEDDFVGEAKHLNKIIVKNNEPGAYGVGCSICPHLNIISTRVATKKEYARVIGCNTIEIKNGFDKIKKFNIETKLIVSV